MKFKKYESLVSSFYYTTNSIPAGHAGAREAKIYQLFHTRGKPFQKSSDTRYEVELTDGYKSLKIAHVTGWSEAKRVAKELIAA